MSGKLTVPNPNARRLRVAILAVLSVMASMFLAAAPAQADACSTGNAIACENSKPGSPASEWDIQGAGDASIQGFATDISYNVGQTAKFKIKTTASAYTINIYRLGWYGGDGARKVATVSPSVSLPQTQPTCASDSTTGLYDCGNWAVSAQWAVPSDAVSGVYIAKLSRADLNDSSQITFIVRNDASHSDVVFQTSDATWQAYNTYGGSNLYSSDIQRTDSQARAFKVSYNRPFATRDLASGRDFLFSNEYPTLKFLERQGYDVSYISSVDSDRFGSLLTNHKTFMSVGHDEYWSQAQRTNVELARDSGVNLMFLSGNEVYWHTRYEKSIDGSSTDYRTLVCYKITWETANIDPTGESTSTWRDPRFAGAPGGSPENALTGTMYMSNDTDLPITVTAAQGKLRLWRNTSLTSMAAGTTTALAPHTVGYESDEDLDNGFRPAGLMDLSTTTGPTPQYLQDFGTQTASGTTTHHLTLYRAGSGALVFGAGTIQWGWGLDTSHDGDNSNPADSRMQQATINMLADMHALPTTLMSGLVQPTTTADTQAPTVTVAAPSSTATLANGAQTTVSGTATDTGGTVSNVEVSLDGGLSYHRATGTTAWSYTGTLQGKGADQIKVRANDDSANLSTPVVVGATVNCPCSIFGLTTPAKVDSGDGSAAELGVKLQSQINGFISGVRFYKSAANTGVHIGTLWSSTGTQLAAGTFVNETASGWQTLAFPAPVAVTANTTYVVSYWAPNGHYALDSDAFWYRDHLSPPLKVVQNTSTQLNGVFANSHSFPTGSFKSSNYFVDVVFSDRDDFPPTVTSQKPLPNSSSVSTGYKPAATFSEPVQQSSIQFVVRNPSGQVVPGSVAYASATMVATFTPDAALADLTTYSVSVTASDLAGNPMTAPSTWSFTTAAPGSAPGTCPCTLFDDSAEPAVVTVNEAATLELGVKFTAESDGAITAVRFYKGPQNVGTHTGSLWTSTGTLLATATFTNESATGWQTVSFPTPVSVSAGTTYLASYKTTGGYYSANWGAFDGVGLDAPPLHIPATGGAYAYGGGFPANGSSANYWVDVVYTVPPNVPPTVSATTPTDGTTGVSSGATVSASFSNPIQPGSAALAVATSSGSVAGTVAYASATRTVTFTPTSALVEGTVFTATVSGARNLGGTPMAPMTFQFTTAGIATCPCTLFSSTAGPTRVDSGDGGSVSLGVKFTPSADGYVSAIRFYKSALNTGTHVGSIWSAAGARLGSVTFAGESGSGWQTATFSQPITVAAGTTYVASYLAPNGHYSIDSPYFSSPMVIGPLTAPGSANGVYRYGGDAFPSDSFAASNYWVTPVYQPGTAPDLTPPTVATRLPANGAVRVDTGVQPSATFSEPVQSGATFVLKKGTTVVAGSTSYSATSQALTFTPSTPLDAATVYTASVQATDLAGNAMSSPDSWSFTTAGPQTCPCTIFADSEVPDEVTVPDPGGPVQLGVAFTPATDGVVSGVRFYKGPNNTGTHTGALWTSSGTQLGGGTFVGESASGWQTLTFGSPIPVTAGTTYVASYFNPAANWSVTRGQFATEGLASPPLSVPVTGGRYSYGSGFVGEVSGSNYWVDVVFGSGGGAASADSVAPTITAPAAAVSGTTATVTWSTDESSTSTVSYGTTPALGSTASGVSGTSHSVTLSGLADSTAYYYRVTSVDAAANSATSPPATSGPATFATADTTPPAITAVASALSGTTATVTWATDESATSTVSYGTTTALGSIASGASGTSHAVTLSGLTDGTTYYYRVTSVDAASNSATSPAAASAPATFATADTTPPVITAVASAVSGTTATVTWTTDESSTSVVGYGTTTALGSTSTGASGTSHSVTLSGLADGTTYYYRVTSADAASNSATSPAAASAPATFATADTTPPVITAVTASGSGTSATASWTTNESATTRVDYGTTTALGSSATGATGTSHTVTLAGLTANTRYYYRVTSVDAATNSATSPASPAAPASYIPTVQPVIQSTAADFTAGTQLNTTVALNGAGEVILTPTAIAEFSGTVLPTGWTSTALVTGGTSTVTGGSVTVAGSRLSTNTTWTTGRTVEMSGTIGNGQRVGWGSTVSTAVTASFSQDSSGQLLAVVNDGGSNNRSTVITGTFTAGAHAYRVDWASNAATFFVDGVQVNTGPFLPSVALKAMLSDPAIGGGDLVVDWVRVGPYAASGTFTSTVIDAGATVGWDTLAWTGSTPTGTTMQVQVRSGPAPSPNGSWTAWATVPTTGASITRSSRYLQYQVILTSTGTRFSSSAARSFQIGFHVL